MSVSQVLTITRNIVESIDPWISLIYIHTFVWQDNKLIKKSIYKYYKSNKLYMLFLRGHVKIN